MILYVNTFKENSYYFTLANQFLGLARGPIDHDASSVINSVASGAITMGDSLILTTTIPDAEILSRVETSAASTTNQVIYGIAVGGDTDGIYGDGQPAIDDLTRATASAGQGVVVVTQGRCPARVAGQIQNGVSSTTDSAIVPGDALVPDPLIAGRLVKAPTAVDIPVHIIARALQNGVSGANNIIAIDVQREGFVELQ